MVLNMPALLASVLLSWPLDYFRPGLPEWVSDLPVLPLIPFFWYWLGSRADKTIGAGNSSVGRWGWTLLLLFIFVCAAASSISGYVGGYTSFIVFAIAIWLVVAIGVKVCTTSGKDKSKIA